MESYYEITITLGDERVDTSAPVKDRQDARRCLQGFKRIYPASEGFKVTATYWECRRYDKTLELEIDD